MNARAGSRSARANTAKRVRFGTRPVPTACCLGVSITHTVQLDCLHRSGGLNASNWGSAFGGSKLACREGGAKSMLISGGDIASAWPNSGIGWFSDGNGSEFWLEKPFTP